MSRVGKIWPGKCPDDDSEMYANTNDYFECPQCRICIRTVGSVVVLPELGNGSFKRDASGARVSAMDILSVRMDLRITEETTGAARLRGQVAYNRQVSKLMHHGVRRGRSLPRSLL